MSNGLQIFNNPEFGQVRTLIIDNEPFFVGKDVAEILGYAKPLNALASHVDEDDSLKRGLIDSLGRKQDTIIINESGLYSLILSSKLPEAKKFKRWVTSEVLPVIRKKGGYVAQQTNNTARESFIRAEAMLRNARVRQAKMLHEIAQQAVTESAKTILLTQAANITAGEKILKLPKANPREAITAEEICRQFRFSDKWKSQLGKELNKRLERNEKTGYKTQTMASGGSRKEVPQWNWYVDVVMPVVREMQKDGVFDGHYKN